MSLDRRTFLKGLGTAVALPALDAMVPARAIAALAPTTAAAPPTRMAFLFTPNGVNMNAWRPTAEGAMSALPETLAPLAKVKNHVNVLTGLTQHHAFANGDGAGDHARSTACYLTGVQPYKTAGSNIKNGISADQLAALKVGNRTKFASLEIGCERGGQNGDCDSGYSCAYSSNISWRSENQPVAKEVNPRLVYERLFGNGAKGEEAEAKSRRDLFRRSVLDFVSEDAASLKAKLGVTDRRKLDEYFTGVREIERRLAKFENGQAALVAAGAARPTGVPADYAEHLRLMGDMMILAFQADLTRISTFMFANDGSNRSYHQIGVAEGHHDVSHHGNDAEKLAKKKLIDKFHVEQLAYILGRMSEIKEADGRSLLDHTMLVYGAGISDGDRHNHDDLPILLCGGGAGLKGGRHVIYKHHTPLNNLYVSMLDRMGIPGEKLGDSNGSLAGLF